MKKKEIVKCPFKVGEIVIFSPSDHCRGWHQESFERLRIYPGYKGRITRIEKGKFIYLDDDKGGFNWIEFNKSAES